MNERKAKTNRAKGRMLVLTLAVCLLLTVAVINFISVLAEYNETMAEKEELLSRINATKENIEELEYWIDAPMDDEYIVKFAREKLGLYRADEVVFVGNAEE